MENFIERLVITAEDRIITVNDLPEFFMDYINKLDDDSYMGSLERRVDEFQKKIVMETLKEQKSIRKTAEILDISKSKAARLINKYK